MELTGGSHQRLVGQPRFGEVGPAALLYCCPHLSWSVSYVHLWSGCSGGSMDPSIPPSFTLEEKHMCDLRVEMDLNVLP